MKLQLISTAVEVGLIVLSAFGLFFLRSSTETFYTCIEAIARERANKKIKFKKVEWSFRINFKVLKESFVEFFQALYKITFEIFLTSWRNLKSKQNVHQSKHELKQESVEADLGTLNHRHNFPISHFFAKASRRGEQKPANKHLISVDLHN